MKCLVIFMRPYFFMKYRKNVVLEQNSVSTHTHAFPSPKKSKNTSLCSPCAATCSVPIKQSDLNILQEKEVGQYGEKGPAGSRETKCLCCFVCEHHSSVHTQAKTTKTIVKPNSSISFNGKTMEQPKTEEDDDMVVWT